MLASAFPSYCRFMELQERPGSARSRFQGDKGAVVVEVELMADGDVALPMGWMEEEAMEVAGSSEVFQCLRRH